MGDSTIILVIIVFVVLAVITIIAINNSSDDSSNEWVDVDEFERRKNRLKFNCSEAEFDSFFDFLKSYKGGFIRRRGGQIVLRDYLGKEKGALKGIFFIIVVPNYNIPIHTKEEFRKFLIRIGVNGVNERPRYEERDSKLKNTKSDQNEWERKEVGNKGENSVRNVLKVLNSEKQDFHIINGVVLKCDDETREFDHIVVGKTGVFCLETKAFGMKNGEDDKASLFIDPGDKWIIRKNGNNKDLTSPTEQMRAEELLLEKVLKNHIIDVHPVLVLSNKKIFVKNNIKLSYDIVKIDELVEYITSFKDCLNEGDSLYILETINKARIN